MIGRLQRRVEGDAHFQPDPCSARLQPRAQRSASASASTGECARRRRRETGGSPNRTASASMPGSIEKSMRTRCFAGGAEPRAARPGRGSALPGLGRAPAGSPGGTSKPEFLVLDQLGNCRKSSVEMQASLWLCASISTFGRPSRSPSPRDLGRQDEQVRLAVGGEHLRLGPGAPPFDPPRQPESLRLFLQRGTERAAADMDKAPCAVRGSSAKAASRSFSPFCHRAPNRENDGRPARSASVPHRCYARSGGRESSQDRSRGSKARRNPGEGASSPDGDAPAAVQVTAQSASPSFSRFSHSGSVQMSLAWAETDQPRPAIIAA